MARDYEPDRRGFAELLRSPALQSTCMDVARDLVPTVVAVTPRADGSTAASTRAEPDRGSDGRAGAKVVQAEQSVQTQFGNARTPRQNHLNRALGGLG